MSSERIVATYLIETPHPVEHAAEVVAGEQSSGTFVELPGETDTLQQRHGARIERIEELETVNAPRLRSPSPWRTSAAACPPCSRRWRGTSTRWPRSPRCGCST